MTNILAIDPGGVTTGIVMIHAGDDAPARVVSSWSLDGSISSYLTWWNSMIFDGVDVLVCEQFVSRNVRGADLSPLRLQGAIEVLAMDAGLDVALQPAGGKDSAVTDAAMTRVGITKRMFVGDNHDDRYQAARHGLWYLKRTKHLPTLNAMYPR